MLALPLLWAAFAGETTVNEYTVPIIPPQLVSDIKDCWVGADVNPIEKISLAVQQLGDQLLIVAICHPALPTMETQVDRVDAVDGETGGDVDVGVDRGVVPATNAGSEGYWSRSSSMELKLYFCSSLFFSRGWRIFTRR